MYLFSSESVSAGHPDKIADQISDLLLDHYLEHDPTSRVAIETFVTMKKIVIAGEVNSTYAQNNQLLEHIVRSHIKKIGYTDGAFNYKDVGVEFLLNSQSNDIAIGVNKGNRKSEGAGDQGIMFGYACSETEEKMPATLMYSHQILQNIYKGVHKCDTYTFGPDAKSQVTVKYDKNGQIDSIATVLVSIQHSENLSQGDIVDLIKPVIFQTIPNKFINDSTKFLFNPTGRFVTGGPEADVGLTGRKIIVDTYGGAAPHGGGAFSGKDSTKVDRSAAYMARYLAKNIVEAGLAEKCLIQLSYAIGIEEPVSVYINMFGTGLISETILINHLINNINLTPRGIRQLLRLDRPIYLPTATYGHFGRVLDANKGLFTWESTDLADVLKDKLG